jgi:predicted DNA-binding transcriptional regulator YafY
MKKLLLKCQLEHKPAEIIYMDQKGRITKRAIFVKKVEGNQITAFCTLREQNRTFELDNILAAQKGAYYETKQTHSWSQLNVGVIKNDAS